MNRKLLRNILLAMSAGFIGCSAIAGKVLPNGRVQLELADVGHVFDADSNVHIGIKAEIAPPVGEKIVSVRTIAAKEDVSRCNHALCKWLIEVVTDKHSYVVRMNVPQGELAN